MERRHRCLAMVTSLLTLVVLASCQPSEPGVRVVSIQDGDSMTVMIGGTEERIRFYGIDAPERGQPFANVSRDGLRALIDDKPIRFRQVDRDVNGRIVAWVFPASTTSNDEKDSLNMKQVENGHAWWFRRFARDNQGLREAEEAARKGRKGLWQEPNPEAPWDFRARNRN